ncbi:hypothetical protein HSBAA_29420 [Vreelandella sulfidaeris]|uniref:Uncharacterized protein n=1 Tax=Vreelandella sulfidaeris TaxID=115553 RepID=A0A455U687_9GAMM|nr:hypothetical protein HSBAA_29420 [Halomonas sulfidaeris]
MFVIDMQRDSGEVFSLHYDHHTNRLTDADGNNMINGVYNRDHTLRPCSAPKIRSASQATWRP